ncbi:NAD(P)H-dependent oxidoreductase subunit E [Nostocoides jenkinsii]|uniref:NAD(P)H-dependent oxidoreductase subunit E n=1 Tax=Nostocoides jenkinsii TaxID=330834 RepID=UPI00069E0883|nr:NAD(P)H-dependent oxidoreductase subunit E [Tetrasphaera jenkinsii]
MPADAARAAEVRAITESSRSLRGPLLPILHTVVERFGYVSDDDIPMIADVLNLSRADVHGVVSFYHDFRRTPAPSHTVTLCRAEACQSVGAGALYAATAERFSEDSGVEVGEVFCLGNCALGPAGMIDGRLHGRLSSDRIEALGEGWTR